MGHSGRSKNPAWLHTVWTEFTCHSGTNAAQLGARCSHRHSPNEVQTLKMLDIPQTGLSDASILPCGDLRWPLHSTPTPITQLRYVGDYLYRRESLLRTFPRTTRQVVEAWRPDSIRSSAARWCPKSDAELFMKGTSIHDHLFTYKFLSI